MIFSELIKKLQSAMNAKGSKLTVDGDPGPVTRKELEKYSVELSVKKIEPIPGPPAGDSDAFWMNEVEKHKGKKESDSVWNKYLSGFWKIVGLPGYKTIVGTSFAWCGLFVAMVMSNSGLKWDPRGAGAKNWADFGTKIEWQVDGIPRGAILHIDHDKDCKGGGNHVAFANGDCAPEDLKKTDTIDLLGGNQSNQVKVSTFSVGEICAVRWPAEAEKPAKVLKSVNCTSKKAGGESTR